jgi:hypothetical protein
MSIGIMVASYPFDSKHHLASFSRQPLLRNIILRRAQFAAHVTVASGRDIPIDFDAEFEVGGRHEGGFWRISVRS